MYRYKCKICGNTQSSDYPPSFIHICDFCGHVDIPLWAINLYECNDIPYIIRVLKAEQQRRAEKDPVGVIYYWETRDNNVMRIDTMPDTHLENTIKMLERKIKREESGIKESLEEVWLRSWILHRSSSIVQVWLRNWVNCRTRNKVKLWLRNWISHRST